MVKGLAPGKHQCVGDGGIHHFSCLLVQSSFEEGGIGSESKMTISVALNEKLQNAAYTIIQLNGHYSRWLWTWPDVKTSVFCSTYRFGVSLHENLVLMKLMLFKERKFGLIWLWKPQMFKRLIPPESLLTASVHVDFSSGFAGVCVCVCAGNRTRPCTC